MSRKKKNDEDVIIEAEIIDEKPHKSAPKSGATTEASVKTSDLPPVKNTAARIAWGIALLLIAFIGGIFMEPLAEQGLKRLGLIKQQPVHEEAQLDLEPLTLAQQEQQKQLKTIESAFNTQKELLVALQNENAALKRDMATLASGLTADTNSMPVDGSALAQVTERLGLLEASLLDVQSKTLESQTEENVIARLEGALILARAESAQLLERLIVFEQSFKVSQSTKLSDSAEGRSAVTLHRLYLNATAGTNYSADLAALKPEIARVPLLNLQPVSKALVTLEANQGGIATHSEIVQNFDALIPSLIKASQAGQSTGWLANFFTVRRTDARAEGVEAIIRSIEIHLANRDLVAANRTADGLPDPLKALTKEWQDTVMARVNTLTALTSLLTTLAGDSS